MASIRRSPNSPYLLACFTLPDGRRTNRSTKTSDRAIAQRLANEWDDAARQARCGRFVELQSRRLLNAIVAQLGGSPQPEETVGSFLEKWLAGKEASTRERYSSALQHFLRHLGNGGNMPLHRVSYQDILDFMQMRQESAVAPKTLLLELRVLQAAFALAVKLDQIRSNPVQRALAMQPVRAESSARASFSPEQVAALVAAAEGDWRTMVLLGFFTGARLGDCANLRWQDVDLSRAVIDFEPSKTRRSHKRVVVPLHPELRAHLEKIAPVSAEGFICPSLAGRKTAGNNGLSAQFARLMAKAGIDAESSRGLGQRAFSKLSFHSLRHSFVSALSNAGVAAEVRMELAGHASVAVHQGYSHTELSTLKAAVEKLPGLS